MIALGDMDLFLNLFVTRHASLMRSTGKLNMPEISKEISVSLSDRPLSRRNFDFGTLYLLTCRCTTSLISRQLLRSRMERNGMTKRRALVSRVFCWRSNIYIYIIGVLLNDDELLPHDETEIALRACLPSIEAQDFEDEAMRVVARARHTRPSYTKFDDIPLPLRVPRSTDPSIWSFRVKVGMLHYL